MQRSLVRFDISKINVVNRKTHTPQQSDYYIGRPSTLGNPFSIDMGRAECISKYKTYIHEKLFDNVDPDIVQAFMDIINIGNKYGEVNLVCYCAPLPCHGDIIKSMIVNGIKDMED